MVVRQSKHFEGLISSTMVSHGNNNHRCLKVGVGHLDDIWTQGVWGPKEQTAYQWPGYLGCDSGSDIVPSALEGSEGTVVHYINKQGGTKSPTLCLQTWELWGLALENNIQLIVSHIAGQRNVLADRWSRVRIPPSEWSLNKSVVSQIFARRGRPLIDPFATGEIVSHRSFAHGRVIPKH